MVQAGLVSPESYLDLTTQLSPETTSLAEWTSAIDGLRQIDDLERDFSGAVSPSRTAFRKYARSLIRPVLDRLGWDPKANEPALYRYCGRS